MPLNELVSDLMKRDKFSNLTNAVGEMDSATNQQATTIG